PATPPTTMNATSPPTSVRRRPPKSAATRAGILHLGQRTHVRLQLQQALGRRQLEVLAEERAVDVLLVLLDDGVRLEDDGARPGRPFHGGNLAPSVRSCAAVSGWAATHSLYRRSAPGPGTPSGRVRIS